MIAARKLRKLRAAIVIKRQQIKAVLAATITGSNGQGPQAKKQREEARFSWADHVRKMSEAQFKLRYRLDFDSFNLHRIFSGPPMWRLGMSRWRPPGILGTALGLFDRAGSQAGHGFEISCGQVALQSPQ